MIFFGMMRGPASALGSTALPRSMEGSFWRARHGMGAESLTSSSEPTIQVAAQVEGPALPLGDWRRPRPPLPPAAHAAPPGIPRHRRRCPHRVLVLRAVADHRLRCLSALLIIAGDCAC